MENSSGIITILSASSVADTLVSIEKALTSNGIFIYAIIDQEAEAHKVGLTLKPLRLLIFGNPKGGIPLMNANPLCGLDLPLKIMVWQDDENRVWLSYNSFSYLQKRFDLSESLISNMKGIEKLIQQALNK
jgi:uncharacterized protein (DUF302 family)